MCVFQDETDLDPWPGNFHTAGAAKKKKDERDQGNCQSLYLEVL